MADRAFEGQFRLYWIVDGTIADGVDVAALTGATDLTSFLPTSGIAIEGTENNASLAMIDKGFVSESVGTEAATATLTLKRDDDPATDPFFTFSKNDVGLLVAVPFGGADYSPTASDEIEVYEVEAHTPVPLPPAENTKQQCRITFAVQDRDLGATVAA